MRKFAVNFIGAMGLAASLLLTGIAPAEAADSAWTPATFHFASKAEAAKLLGVRDDYVARLSPGDRAMRLQTDQPVSEAQYLAHVTAAVQDWSDADKQAIGAALNDAISGLNTLGLPAPAAVTFIKTDGSDEGEAAYTRGAAIILPVQMLGDAAELRWLVAHELFHVISRANPALSEALYTVIGFHRADDIQLPAEVAAHHITNPDALRENHFIRVLVDGKAACAVPVVVFTLEQYDLVGAGSFLRYADVQFFVTDKPYRAGMPGTMLHVAEFTGFLDQVGMNTDDIMHPEEIVAENFALILNPTAKPRSPQVVAALRNAILQYVANGPDATLTADPRGDSCAL